MAALAFNDGSGTASLRGVFAGGNNRFRGFTPTVLPVGPSTLDMSTGRSTMWVYRTEYRVTLELPNISPRVYDGESGTVRAGRLIAHLMRGGLVEVAVEDSIGTANNLNCWLAEGSVPALTLENPRDMLYSFSATLARGGDPFVAVYGGLLP
jgi:hypothetical protein